MYANNLPVIVIGAPTSGLDLMRALRGTNIEYILVDEIPQPAVTDIVQEIVLKMHDSDPVTITGPTKRSKGDRHRNKRYRWSE